MAASSRSRRLRTQVLRSIAALIQAPLPADPLADLLVQANFILPGRSQGNQSSHNQNGDLEHGRVRMERCSSCPGSCLSTVGVMASISSVGRLMGTLRLGLQSQVVTPLPKILLFVAARIGRQHGWLYWDSVSKRWPASIVLPCAGPAMETGARNADSTGGHEDRALVLQDRTPAMVTVVQTCVCGWHGLAPSRGIAVIG